MSNLSSDAAHQAPSQRSGWKTRLLSDETERGICEEYLAGATSVEIAPKYGVGPHAIQSALKRNGVKARRPGTRRRHTCNDHFFESIDTATKAYWLGFIAADGCVTIKNQFNIVLGRKDHDHLERLCLALEATNPVKHYRSSSGFPTSSLTIVSKDLTESLQANGIVKRKTLTLEWPQHIDTPLLRHYLRGYFDGDGSLTICPGSKVGVDGTRWQAMVWSLASNDSFCLSAQDFLMESLGLRRTKLKSHNKKLGISSLEYGGPLQVARIVRFLYEDAADYLPRKREKIAHLL